MTLVLGKNYRTNFDVQRAAGSIMLEPETDEIVSSLQPTLTWEPHPFTTHTHLRISQYSAETDDWIEFERPVNLEGSSYTIQGTLVPGGKYEWSMMEVYWTGDSIVTESEQNITFYAPR